MTDNINLCLSVRQPWAWLIVNGHKDVENRTWWLPLNAVMEDCYIHAPQTFDLEGYAWVQKNMPEIVMPLSVHFERGGIVGACKFVNCVREMDSPWFFGPYGFVVKHPRVLPFVKCAGKLGFFKVPAGVMP